MTKYNFKILNLNWQNIGTFINQSSLNHHYKERWLSTWGLEMSRPTGETGPARTKFFHGQVSVDFRNYNGGH